MSRLWIVILLLPMAAARGQTSYPMVSRVEPAAVRRGQTVELTLSTSTNGGGDVSGAFAVLAQPHGLRGEVIASDKVDVKAGRASGSVRIRLEAAPDAPLGPRELRVATPRGASSVVLVVVVDGPVVTETDDKLNDAPKGAQTLGLPCVVSGTVGKTEDVDWYAVEAKAGQRLTFTVWANRLENKVHDLQTHLDPILALFDSTGRELANDDNHSFADPRLSYEFKASGRYLLQVRDTTYGGNPNWTYVLEATAGPVVSAVSPLAVNPGRTAELRARGPNLDPSTSLRLDVPGGLPSGPCLFSLSAPGGRTPPVALVVTSLNVVEERDDAANGVEKAQPIEMPAALCGKLAAPNDLDTYRFEARKGTAYTFEAFARRAGAGTDPVVRLLDGKGATVAEVDDTPGLGKDARLDWTAPADGPCAVQVADLHGRGGDEFGYVVEAQSARPDFSMTCDPDKINVGPGGRVPLFVQVVRRGGFDGPVAVALQGLPPGVSASPLVIGPKMTQGVTVVSAAKDARPAAGLLALEAAADTANGPIIRAATPRQEIYLPGGGRGTYPVETLALAVTDPSDVTVEATPPSITLRPGGTATIDVEVTRREGFQKGVNLAVVLQHLGGVHASPLPPGVTVREAGGKTLLGPTETKGKIVLEAGPSAAPIDAVPICVMGHVSINFVVKTSYASRPIALSIAK